jgi:hypothetical protein
MESQNIDIKHVAMGPFGKDGGAIHESARVVGLWRQVKDGVVYAAPSGLQDGLAWTPSPSSRGRYEMRFPQPPRRLLTFSHLCADLRKRASEFKKWRCDSRSLPPDLADLDKIVDKILSLAVRFYSEQEPCSLGPLCPDNILILEFSNGEYGVTFADAGFSSRDLRFEPLDPQSGSLWEIACNNEPEEKRDVQVLAWIFCWALLGDTFRESFPTFPSPEQYPETKAQPARVKKGRRVWIILEDAVRGKIPTFVEFEKRLKEYPLSQHFLSNAGGRRRSFLYSFLILIPFLILIFIMSRPKPPPGNDQQPGTTGKPENKENKLDEEKAKNKLDEIEKALYKEWEQYQRDWSPTEFYNYQEKFRKLLIDMNNEISSLSSGPEKQSWQDKYEWWQDLLKKELGL